MESHEGHATDAQESPMNLDAEARKRILHRLRRLEGQLRGLQGMIEEGRSCREVLTLLAGVRSALNASGDLILEHYVETCGVDLRQGPEGVRELLQVVKLSRG
jgi:CsoR family transcriptional regulator, copper-sensing transcriptional repressor